MKKQNRILLIGALLLILFLSASWFTFHQSRAAIENGYLDAEGNAAENFAVLTASNIHLTDEQVILLKNYSYAELMDSDENNNLKRMNAKHTGEYFALVISDIDFFKKVNDTFGHDIGDEVLVDLGQILNETFGKSHVVRFGGEEFICGFWISSKEELEIKMKELFARIEKYKFSTQRIDLTISSGCCYYKTDALDGWIISGMLKAADCKLYESKENGRNQFRTEQFDKDKTYNKVKAKILG